MSLRDGLSFVSHPNDLPEPYGRVYRVETNVTHWARESAVNPLTEPRGKFALKLVAIIVVVTAVVVSLVMVAAFVVMAAVLVRICA